jgi:MFS family permease
LIAAEAISAFGSQLSALAIPWFVLITTGSPARMGVVFAVELLPLAILGIPSGSVLDRLGARKTMLICDAVRAPVLALVPLLHLLGEPSFAALLVIVAVSGVFSTPYFAAQRLVIPEVVGDDEVMVARGNALVEGATNLANFGGPAAAGILIAALGAVAVLWIDAATFVISFALIALLVPAPYPKAKSAERIHVLDGLRYVIRDRPVARAAASSIVFGFVFRLLFVSFPLLAFYRYDRDPRIAGWLFAIWGGGAIVGSVAAYRLVALARPMRAAAVAGMATALPLWLLVPNLGFAFIAAGVALSAAAIPTINAPYLAMLSTRVPHQLQGRVLQSIMTIANFAGPLAYLVAAPTIIGLGLTWSYAIIAAAATVAGLNFVLAAAEITAAASSPVSG